MVTRSTTACFYFIDLGKLLIWPCFLLMAAQYSSTVQHKN